nr:MAG TPA: hypothetical protein [Caudoviricetes sp.]
MSLTAVGIAVFRMARTSPRSKTKEMWLIAMPHKAEPNCNDSKGKMTSNYGLIWFFIMKSP